MHRRNPIVQRVLEGVVVQWGMVVRRRGIGE